MKPHLRLALLTGALALALVPATALAVTYHPVEYKPTPPGPPPHAKAYGFHCKGFSKKHVKGEKGTPFSRCVKAMARADNQENLSPGQVCKAQKFSKKHVKGEKGTPFSRCVKAVVQLRKEQRELGLA
jgi:hypothetical protein